MTKSKNLTILGSAVNVPIGTASNTAETWAGYQANANIGATQVIYEARSDRTETTAAIPLQAMVHARILGFRLEQ
jgi:hypothetical protein